MLKQECIRVGCVPCAAVAVGGGGSASVHAGIHPPVCGPGYPVGVGLETPLDVGLENPASGCGPGDPPQVWTWRNLPSGVGLETPWVWVWRHSPGVGLETPLGVGLETSPPQTPQLPPCVWAWRPLLPDPSTSPLGVGLETCKACWDTTCNACWDTTPPYRILDTCY